MRLKHKTYGPLAVMCLPLCGLFLWACSGDSEKANEEQGLQVSLSQIEAAEFNEDSAYEYVKRQVEMGPRVPNSPEHKQCALWLEAELRSYTDHVHLQEAKLKAHDGKQLDMINIIASFNPEQKFRILLAGHWDTRPMADEDTTRQDEAIPGANDGASGTGVLLEIARQLAINPIGIGIDIILFDLEDSGVSDVRDSYCLGSQYWSKRPHNSTYKARYGIVLDMVGGTDAIFAMEGTSMKYAAKVVRSVWDVANRIGHSKYFVFRKTPDITDDHLYINIFRRIPTIDIIQFDQNTVSHFAPYWHTHKDNMNAIDKRTLKAVGQTVLTVLHFEDKKQEVL